MGEYSNDPGVAPVPPSGLTELTTKGDLHTHDGTDGKRIGVGTNDQVLLADSAQTLGVKWGAVPAGTNTFIFLHPQDTASVVAGTWATIVSTNQRTGNLMKNTSASDADEITYTVRFPVGDWKVNLSAEKGGDQGIVDIYVDGTERHSADLYAASGSQNNMSKSAAFSISSGGDKTVRVVVDGKNGSSSNYQIAIGEIFFEPVN